MVGDGDVAVVDRHLQAQVPLRHPPKRLTRFARQFAHRESLLALEGLPRALPPEVDGASAVSEHVDRARASASLAHLTLVGKADVDPALDRAGDVALRKVALVFAAEAAG